MLGAKLDLAAVLYKMRPRHMRFIYILVVYYKLEVSLKTCT